MQDLIQRASQYATVGHQRIDQRRKYTGKPYDVHLKAVAELVQTVTDDPEMIAAAWLHDIVEDTPITIEALETEFGAAVAQLVTELTDASKPSDGNRAKRKAIDRAKLAQASPRAKTIKLADLIDNCLDICKHDPRFAKTFLTEAFDLWQVLSEGHPKLYQRAHKVILKCSAEIGLPEPQATDEFDTEQFQARSLLLSHQRTLRLFAQAFSVEDIAEPLRSFDKETPISQIIACAEKHHLQIVGIRHEGVLNHYLIPPGARQTEANGTIRPIRSDQILDWERPLYDVILVLTRNDYCFVSVLGSITGVITRADIQKPVVRMWLFGIITLVESELTNRIDAKWSDDGWAPLVSPKRLERARDLWNERKRRNQPCTLLSCLQLSDKALIMLQDSKTLKEYGFSSKGSAKRVLKEIESLRNNLAHAQDIVSNDWAQIARMARNFFEHAWNW